jgi:hypothetical protein
MKKMFIVFFIVLTLLAASAVMNPSVQNGEAPADYFNEDLSRPDDVITINAAGYLGVSRATVGVIEYNNVPNALVWTGGGEITYRINVRTSGHYLMEATYLPLSGSRGRVELEIITQNGSSHKAGFFRYRLGGEITASPGGDELPPATKEINRWLTRFMKNGSTPLYVYLEAGEQLITLRGEDVNTAFAGFAFRNYYNPPHYAEIKPDDAAVFATPPLETDNETGSRTIFLQAEQPTFVTGADVGVTGDHVYYNVIPASSSRKLYNTLGGGGAWSAAGQAASWEFGVAYDGYYRISVKARQNVNPQASSYRRVLINNIVPVREFNAVEFRYNKGDWYRRDLTDADGNDIYVFLKAGRNTLTLEAVNDSPLELDYIEIATVHEDFIHTSHNLRYQFIFSFGRLINSYLGSSESAAKSVDVWVGSDRETMLVLREFVRREYDCDDVSIRLVSGTVLEAALAGKPPCVALFMSTDETERLARRGLAVECYNSSVLLRDGGGAREFWEWFISAETQAGFMNALAAAKGVSEYD